MKLPRAVTSILQSNISLGFLTYFPPTLARSLEWLKLCSRMMPWSAHRCLGYINSMPVRTATSKLGSLIVVAIAEANIMAPTGSVY